MEKVYSVKNSDTNKLESLFEVWPSNSKVDNAKDIKLINYSLCGVIKDSVDIIYYADLLTHLDSPFLSMEGNQNGNNESKYFRLNSYLDILRTVSQKDLHIVYEQVNNELCRLRTFIKRNIQIGNYVFVINFEYKGNKMRTFMFYDEDSDEIVLDLIFKELIDF